MKQLILQPPSVKPSDTRLKWCGLHGDSDYLAIANFATQQQVPILLVTADAQTAQIAHTALQFFLEDDTLALHYFPDWETLPYDHFSPHEEIISNRIETLYHIPRLQQGLIVTSVATLSHQLCPLSYIEDHTFILRCGDTFSLTQHREQLIKAGYRSVSQVMEHGEFALRGSIIDIFPTGSPVPFRIELFDNEVDTIRSFDPETQRSITKIDKIRLLPAKEFPLTEESIEQFRKNWRQQFPGNPQNSIIYQAISQGKVASGIEYYLSLFFTTQNLFDYLPKNTVIFFKHELEQVYQNFWQGIEKRHEQLRYDIQRPICDPKAIYLSYDQCRSAMKLFPQIEISNQSLSTKAGVHHFKTSNPPALPINHHAKKPLELFENFAATSKEQQSRILICVPSAGRRETLVNLFNEHHISTNNVSSWAEFLNLPSGLYITIAPLQKGMSFADNTVTVITESQLFGKQVQQRRTKMQRQVDPNTLIRNLTELRIGDPVVHIDHGVGRYQGLQTIKTGDIEAEYLTLSYANNDKIYVPVASLYLVSRYTGTDAAHAPLQKLGTTQWQKIKDKTAKRVRDVAAELLEIYGRRQSSRGFAFQIPEKEYRQFREEFPFEETEDQTAAIRDVIKDMQSTQSMERLVCGDVGFGKTEVAMQAAFIATQNHKQAAVLVPTTLLAEQHEHNFKDRFAEWPIKIAAMSRLRTTKQRQQITSQLKAGQIDIVIGTHQLLSGEIEFKDLGLLIVDEEHRFGVRQKEKIKSLCNNVDILTLTATPIPRTLNMAMVGIRDFSIIATPPHQRLAVKTFVSESSESLIREAIMRETLRGGQVYFLHNAVATIQATAEKIQSLLPDLRIGVAHGQMRERELERIMSDFYHQRYHVLVCTTIIESGIDVPTANTIIIERADRFGLAQLHQLRGRVGRSHHQAYAYLLAPPTAALTSDGKKRLQAIAELDQLGVGFNLATHDLEIRGAGEMLGDEQSGHIHEVGFTLYLELLEQAVSLLKAGKSSELETVTHSGPEIDLGVSALLPQQYIGDVNTRLILYKRLANCKNKQEIIQIREELVDRFGTLPQEAHYLFQTTELKCLAMQARIKKITLSHQYGYIHFMPSPSIDINKLATLIQKNSETYQLQGSDRLRFCYFSQNVQEHISDLFKLLNFLI